MIDQNTVDRILEAANIVEVVSDFVTLRKRGVNYTGLCPFHNEKTPSFSVSPSKGICKCFSCGKGGSAVYFIMEHEQLSYVEALKYLARKYGIEVQERELSPQERQVQNERESMLLINSFAQEYFARTLFEHTEGRSIGLAYFRERGFTDDVLRKFGLGYSLEQRDALYLEAVSKGYKAEYLLKTGLCLEGQQSGHCNDRFRGRVIFPVYSLSGKVLAFGGRVLRKDDKTAKYVNSPESEIYHKSNELYGLFQAKQAIVKKDTCYLVEGYTDVLSMYQSGIENVVASSGTALTPGQIRLIHRFTNHITVIYDGDAAGIKASLRGIDMILKEGLNVKVVLLPNGEDPDSFSKSLSAEAFEAYINEHQTDFIRFKTNLLLTAAGDDPLKRAELIQEVVNTIAIIPDTITRSVYTTECSRLLSIGEEVLMRAINTIKRGELAAPTPKLTPVISPTVTESTLPTAGSCDVAQDKALDVYEAALIRYIIRYGDYPISPEADEQKVVTYVLDDLAVDDITWHNPLYALIAQEAMARIKSGEGLNERYFLSHPNAAVSAFATDVVSEKYQLSKIHTRYQKVETEVSRLKELLPRALYELKDAILQGEVNRLRHQLKTTHHPQQSVQLMTEIAHLMELRALLAKELGERIVLPRK